MSGSLPNTNTNTSTNTDTADDDVLAVAEIAADQASLAPQRRAMTALLGMLDPLVLPDTTEPGRFPSAWLRRLVEVRDVRCTGPGCRRQARLCDLDHEIPRHDNGPTAEWNLSAKSLRCHLARHHGWTADRDPTTGVTTWNSPTGDTYTRRSTWTRHKQHPCVVSISPQPLQLPTADTDHPTDGPLWRPRYRTETAPPAAPAQRAPKKDAPSVHTSWGTEPPPF